MSTRYKGGHHGDSASTLERLVGWHHTDQPAMEQRERLLNNLRRTGVPHKAVAASWVDPPATRDRRIALAVGMVASAGLAVLLWAMQSGEQPQAKGNTNHTAAKTAEHSAAAQPCFVASGRRGSLWAANNSSPDLARLDGRTGRWLHQWVSEAGNQRAIPDIVALEGGKVPRYSLQARGTHATGWGAKLGTALRVQVENEPEAVRFECYDASAYAGLSFRARGTGIVYVLLQTSDSTPEALGGRCQSKCWFTASYAVALDSEVRDYHIPWDRFSATESTRPPQSQLMLLEFLVPRRPDPYEIEMEAVQLMSHSTTGANHPGAGTGHDKSL